MHGCQRLAEICKILLEHNPIECDSIAVNQTPPTMTKKTFISPTYSLGDVDGYSWAATNMPPSLCERVGVTSRTTSDALASLAAGAWQANHRHLYVATRSEMQRRGLLGAAL